MTRRTVGMLGQVATLAVAALLAPLASPAGAQADTVDFAPVQFFDTGGAGSVALTSADFDDDGDNDVATANEDDDTVSVLFNSGTGALTLDTTYPVGEQPWEIIAADLNDDGYPDLAVGNATSSDISILLNDGDGTFAAELVEPTGFTPTGITAADVDGDGDIDLLTSDLGDNTVTVLLGDGSGGFTIEGTVPVGLEPSGITSGDVTGDGLDDVVVVNSSSDTVSLLVSPFDPDIGTFSEIRDLEVGFAPYRAVLLDLDANGSLDIAVHVNSLSSFGPDYVSVLLNDGAGSFAPSVDYPAVGVRLAAGIAAGDFNDDGFDDVAVSGLDTDTIGVLLSDGQGRLGPAQIFDAAGPAESLIAAFLTGSQGPDLAAGYIGESQVGVFANVSDFPPRPLFTPVIGTRIADTRDGEGGVPVGALLPGETLVVDPRGRAGVPVTGVGAVALNVTAAEPEADGYLTVFPCAPSAPNASNVNYRGGQIAEPNAVIVGLGDGGAFCITTSAPTDVIVDVNGWFRAEPGFDPQIPDRIADTRDGTGVPQAVLEPGQRLTIDITDDPSVDGAALNVTAANTTERGYLTVFPCTESAPYASNVNYEPGLAGSPNAVVTGLDADGQVCIETSAPVDVIVDLAGTFLAGTGFTGQVPERVADTRDGEGGVPIGRLPLGAILSFEVTDDPTVTAVSLNVTATEALDNGYLTVFDCFGGPPYSSNVNYTTDELSAANAVLTGVRDGRVCISASAAVHVVVDVTGTFRNTLLS